MFQPRNIEINPNELSMHKFKTFFVLSIFTQNISFLDVLYPHHSKMQKDGWAKYIPNFAFK